MAIPWSTLFILTLVVLIPAPILFPSFCFHVIILLDFFTPFVAFESPIVQSYHKFITDRLPEQPEREPIILPAEGITREKMRIASNDYTVPVVVRGIHTDVAL
jgi:hypothetical protein